jgi:hypothetical protein
MPGKVLQLKCATQVKLKQGKDAGNKNVQTGTGLDANIYNETFYLHSCQLHFLL